MSTNLYNLEVEAQSGWRNPPRVGLLRERTGVPVFLLYLTDIVETRHLELNSLDDVESEILKSSSAWDKAAWEGLIPFFDAEGVYALVLALPLSSPSSPNLVKDMIGKDRGLKERSGIFSLRGQLEFADLVVVPQASQVLSSKDHRLYYKALFTLLDELNHFFAIVDFPKNFDPATIQKWMKGIVAPNAAAYYPWLIKDNKMINPAASVAALYQATDREMSINELPANKPMARTPNLARPMVKLTPHDLEQCLESRLNVVHLFGNGEVRVWGGRTLAEPLDLDGRFISNRRTLLALREAVHQICEPFVLEPLNENLPHLVDVAMQSTFQGLKRLFDPAAKQPFRSQVNVVSRDREDVLEVNVHYSVPYALDEMAFSLALTN